MKKSSNIHIGILLSFMVLYFLSDGPVEKWARDKPAVYKHVLVIYAPITWLYKNTPLRGPIRKYSELWED